MAIVLRVVAFKGVPVEPVEVDFGPFGGSIGRGPENQLALPDPERFISRVQARVVVLHGGGYAIEHYGVNPIAINGELAERGAVTRLAAGDTLLIGGYEIGIVRADTPASGGDPYAGIIEGDADEPPFASAAPRAAAIAPVPGAAHRASADASAIGQGKLDGLFGDTGAGDPSDLERTNILLSPRTTRSKAPAPDSGADDAESPASMWRRLVAAARRKHGGGGT